MYLVWLRVAAVLYGVATIAVFPAVLYGLPRWRRVAVPAAALGFFFHFVSSAEILSSAHRWVPAGMREAETLVGLAVMILFFLIWRIYDAISFGIFALPATFFLVFIPALGPDRYTFPSNGIRTGWLMIHIVALLAAYAALAFSLLASALYLIREHRLKHIHRSVAHTFGDVGAIPPPSFLAQLLRVGLDQQDWLPPLDTLERIAQVTLLVGFPCMTVGLLVGSLLAQETALGAAYFRDPKILASLIVWAAYILLLFIRRSAGLRGRRAAYLSAAVMAAMLAVWAANQFSQVHHFGGQ